MRAKPKPHPAFELRATGKLRVGAEDFVPVAICVCAGVFGQPGAGYLYGPADVLYRAYNRGHAILEVAGVRFRAHVRGYFSYNGWMHFDSRHLLRALARGTSNSRSGRCA